MGGGGLEDSGGSGVGMGGGLGEACRVNGRTSKALGGAHDRSKGWQTVKRLGNWGETLDPDLSRILDGYRCHGQYYLAKRLTGPMPSHLDLLTLHLFNVLVTVRGKVK